MENFSTAVNLAPEDGGLASFGSGNGSRAARGRATNAPRAAAPRGSIRYERGRANRIANVPGRGRRARQAAVQEYLRVIGGTRRPTNAQAQAAFERLQRITGYY